MNVFELCFAAFLRGLVGIIVLHGHPHYPRISTEITHDVREDPWTYTDSLCREILRLEIPFEVPGFV